MPRIHTLSDIHLEFRQIVDPLEHGTPDAIILPGDIGKGAQGVTWAARNYPKDIPVIIIPGNHEYYGGEMNQVLDAMRREAARHSNIAVLDRGEAIIETDDGLLRILGATLWTDYLLNGEKRRADAMRVAEARMNDHRLIRLGNRRFLPQDAAEHHARDLAWLDAKLSEPFTGTTVVATHHAPSRLSTHPRYPDGDLNASFISDLDSFIMKHRPKLWIHGHTHWPVDGYHADTRIVSRQIGYPNEGVPPSPTEPIEVY